MSTDRKPTTATPIRKLWRHLMLACAGGMVAAGGLMVLAPDANALLFNYVSFYQPNFPVSFSAHAIDYIKFLSTVMGAVMIGWGAMVAEITLGSFGRGEAEGWLAITVPVVTWFVIDSAFSLIRGYPGNVGFNLAFFIPVVVPLIATYNHVFPTKK